MVVLLKDVDVGSELEIVSLITGWLLCHLILLQQRRRMVALTAVKPQRTNSVYLADLSIEYINTKLIRLDIHDEKLSQLSSNSTVLDK